MDDNTLMITVENITGEYVLQLRDKFRLSRDKFAELTGIKPGSLWRIEKRNVFKRGERELLVDIANCWAVKGAIPIASDHPPASTTSSLVELLPSKRVAICDEPLPKCDNVDAEHDNTLAGCNTTVIINASDVKFDFTAPSTIDTRKDSAVDLNFDFKSFEIIYPLDAISPTALSIIDGITRISNSEVQTFKRCRRKWWFAYLRRLRLRFAEPCGPMATGTRVHLALAAWYQPDGKDRLDPRDALEIVITQERNALSHYPDLDSHIVSTFSKDIELERVMIDGYMNWLQETGSDADYTIIGAEQYLEAHLPECGKTYIIARLDARVQRIYDNARLFIDHKTVISIPQATRLLNHNEQMLWYILLEELLCDTNHNQRVGGALYNMLRRCKRSARAEPPFYARVEVHHNPIEIKSFRRRLVATISEIKRCKNRLSMGEHHHDVVYPTPTRDCVWDCAYFKVCTMADDGSRLDDAIEDHYIIGDPYDYYVKTPVKIKKISD